MPPRPAKKAPVRGPKGAANAQNSPAVEDTAKVAEISNVEETVVEQNNVGVPSHLEPESKPEPNESAQVKVEETKEVVDEDLDENDTDYDPEEEVADDFDEMGSEEEQPLEEENGEEEDEEGEEGNLEEGDMEEEEMEDVGEEIEGGGDEEEHEELADRGHVELADREHEEHVEEEREELADRGHVELADREHEEHHEVVKERRKRKEFEIFVGGLDKDASENDLKIVFSAVGEIVEVRLMINLQTKKNKGFAFLRFATVEQAKRAVKEMKNPVVNGKQCGVTPSQDSDTLFLGNICKTLTKEALKEKLKQYGIDSVEELTLVEDNNNAGMNRGFAFLDFSSRSDAMVAYKRLQKRDVVFGVDKNAKVAFADSFSEPDDEIMAQVKTVFVDGLPASWDEDRVKEQLKKFGEIENVELARNMPSAKRRDFGFVTFDTHDKAVVCAESINNAELGDGDHKVKVRARLSRPVQKGRGKVTARGRGAPRGGRTSSIKPSTRSFPARGWRGGGRFASARSRAHEFKGSVGLRDRRLSMATTERVRHLPPPSRSYSKKPVPSYSRSSSKKDFVQRDELPPRSRVVVDYSLRAAPERRSSYKDDYAPRRSSYSDDGPRRSARVAPRRPAYVDEPYERRFERPLPTYREGRTHDYDLISGSKRPYSALENVPPHHTEAGVRQSRTRLEYGVGISSSQYTDTYSERAGRSQLGYAGSRTSLSIQEAHGAYGSRHGMSYAEGSYGDRDVGGAYPSSYGSDYMSRRPDVADRTYSSLYSSRLGGGNYPGGGGSGSYY